MQEALFFASAKLLEKRGIKPLVLYPFSLGHMYWLLLFACCQPQQNTVLFSVQKVWNGICCMPNMFIRGMLFLSSYFPLMLIISILLLPQQIALSIALFSVSFLAIVITGIYMLISRRTLAINQEKLIDFEKRDSD